MVIMPTGNVAHANTLRLLTRCAVILISLSLMQNGAFATCVVVVKSGNRVVIGTDSLRKDEITGESFSGCKITRMGNLIVTASGQIQSAPDYDVYALVKKLHTKNPDVQVIVAAFNKAIPAPLKSVLEDIRERNPTRFREMVAYKLNYALQVVFVDISQANARVYASYFPVRVINGEIEIKLESMADKGIEQSQLHRLGVSEAIAPLTMNYFDKPDMVAPVRAAIITEMKAEPRRVGGQIALMLITGNSVRWVQKTDSCADER